LVFVSAVFFFADVSFLAVFVLAGSAFFVVAFFFAGASFLTGFVLAG